MSRISLPERSTWLAALLFTALAVLLAYPLSFHPSSLRFPSGPDGEIGWYLLAWDTHAFLHKPWAIFNANIYYPQDLTLAYGENIIGIALFAAPVIWLTGDIVLAANFASLLSCVLCGLGAYVLARRVGLSVAAALICGIIFECAPPRFFRIGQINLSNVQWIPFGLAALHGYFDTGRKRDLHMAAGFMSLEALSSGHGAVFMAVSLVMLTLYRLVLGEPLRVMSRFRDLGVTGTLLLIPPILMFLPYRLVQQEVGLRRGLGTWEENYSSFIASPSHLHKFLTSLVTDTDLTRTALAFLFPGYLAVVLGVVAVVYGARALRSAASWPRFSAWAPIATFNRIYRRPVLYLLAVFAAWTLLDLAREAMPAGVGLTGQYYGNTNWSDQPIKTVVDLQPSTAQMIDTWNGEPPQTFSAAWNGYLSIVRPGLYFFSTTSMDRSRLYLDGQVVVDNTGGHEYGQAGSIELDRGPHRVTLEYVHLGATTGHAEMKWEWVYNGDQDKTYQVVPRWALSRRAVTTTTAIGARGVEALRAVAWGLVIAAVLWCLLAWPIDRHDAWIVTLAPYRRSATGFYLVLTLGALGLALGPPYGLWQFVYWLPGFNLIRGSSRFMLVGLLGIGMLAGIGFDRISAAMTNRRRTVLATLFGFILLAEYVAIPMGFQENTLTIPSIDRWLDGLPKPFVVAEVPVYDIANSGVFERQETAYMLHSTAHWQKTVHGYSGWRTLLHEKLFAEMNTFPDETSLDSLSRLGVTYIVVHTDYYAPDEWLRVEERFTRFAAWLRLEHVEGSGRVYSLMRPAADPPR